MGELGEPGGITFTDHALQRCPFPTYDRLRKEAPVYHDPVTGNYVLTRFDDVRAAASDPQALGNQTRASAIRRDEAALAVFAAEGWRAMDSLTFMDPPVHGTYRGLVDKIFTAKQTALLEPRIREIVEGLIASLPVGAEFDFMAMFAVPLPMVVIAEQLGVRREDMDEFKLWSDTMIRMVDPTLSGEGASAGARVICRMQNYLVAAMEAVRRRPDGTVISQLVHAEIDGRSLTVEEMLGLVQQLLVAGNETTTTALGAGMKALAERPELAEQLWRRPELAAQFAEEVLRVDAPVQCMFRKARREVTIAGVAIPEGAVLELRFGSANRDGAQFADPARIDLARANSRSHLAFGAGPHFCLGSMLARAELKLAFGALTQAFTRFRATRGEASYAWLSSYITYGISQMWMAMDGR